VNGNPVKSMRDIYDAIGMEVGKTTTFKVKRGWRSLTVNITSAAER
jgi:S1-C subfamily serine protease